MYYLATMIPADSEDDSRILRHRRDRKGWGFETIETGEDILAAVKKCDRKGAFLLDSLTALLANSMFTADGCIDINAYIKITGNLKSVLETTADMILVSDFIFSDVILYEDMTEAYRRGLAYIDRQMAGICDVVLEAFGGMCIAYKGGELLHEFD